MTNNIDDYKNDAVAFVRDLCVETIQPWQENIVRSLNLPKDRMRMTATEVIDRQRIWQEVTLKPVVVKLESVQEAMMCELFSAYMKSPPRTMGREEWYHLSHIVRESRRKLVDRIKVLGPLYGTSALVIVP